MQYGSIENTISVILIKSSMGILGLLQHQATHYNSICKARNIPAGIYRRPLVQKVYRTSKAVEHDDVVSQDVETYQVRAYK